MIDYRTKIVRIVEGTHEVSLHIIENLDQAIDQLCQEIERLGLAQQSDPLAEDLCPYFGCLWPSSLALTSFLAEQSAKIQGKKILELGCGLALPSLFASKMGGQCLATDMHPDVPTFLKRNEELNGINVPYKKLNWREQDPLVQKDIGQFDWVIGSDVLYESQHPLLLARNLIRFCAPGGKIVITDPGRSYLQQFVTAMNQEGFKETLTSQRKDETDIFILQFEAKN